MTSTETTANYTVTVCHRESQKYTCSIPQQVMTKYNNDLGYIIHAYQLILLQIQVNSTSPYMEDMHTLDC